MAHLEHFTDRNEQIAAFDALWRMPYPWIIVFTGLSGNGKSTLIDWLIENRCRPQQLGYLKLELFNGLKLEMILDRLAGLLPTESAGYYRQERRNVAQAYHHNQDELLKAAAARPVEITQHASEGGQISQAQIMVQTGQALAQSEALDTLRRRYHGQLIELLLPELHSLPAQPLVIFLDTYERVQESSPEAEVGQLWEVLAAIQAANPQLRVVVGSRSDLTYQPALAWRNCHPLETFSRADSDSFLARWSKGQISPELGRAIFNLVQGHPMLTEMAAQLWAAGQQAGRPLTPAELPAGLHDRAAREWLYGRMINRLEALSEQGRLPASLVLAVRYGPLLRQITLSALNAILPEGVAPLDDRTFRILIGYAFIKPTAAAWTFHELVRQTQQAYLSRQADPEVMACHQRAAQFFQLQMEQQPHPEPRRNWLYHSCFLDPEALFDDWLEAAFGAQLAGDRVWWTELLTVLEEERQYGRLSPAQQADLIRNRGFWHVRSYNMIEALLSYEAALGLFRQVGDRLGEANTLQAIGDVQRFRDENDQALLSYEAALGLFRQVGDRLGEANTLKAIGDVQRFRDENDQALLSYEAALGLFRQVGDRLGEANTLQAIGDVQRFRDENDQALLSYEAALGLFRQVGDRLGEANTLQAIGDVQRFRDENDQALLSYEAALGLFRQVGDRLGEANTLKAIGDVQRFRDENDQALLSYEAALGLFRQVGDRLGEANTLKAIGDVQRFRDENDQALLSYEAALGLFRQVGDRLGEANTLKAIGDVQRFRDENDQALLSYEAALGLFRQVGDRLGEANTLQAIGMFQIEQGSMEIGVETLNQALQLYVKIGDWVGQANIYWGLGLHLAQIGQLKEAEPMLAQSVSLAEQILNPDHPVLAAWGNVLAQVRDQLANSAGETKG